MRFKAFSFLVILGLAFVSASLYEKGTIQPYKFPRLTGFPEMPNSNSNPVSIEGAQLGKYLFYDPILSKDSTISCASCHKQEFAFSDAPNRFSTGITGEFLPRNTMPLFNLAWYNSFFWDGRSSSIEDQVFIPVTAHNEMNLSWNKAVNRITSNPFYTSQFEQVFGNTPIDSILIAKAIAQFERTLISNQSKYDKVIGGEGFLDSLEYAGFVLINDQTKGDCLHCHTTDGDALGTTLKFSNNGLDAIISPQKFNDLGKGEITNKAEDMGTFKIPSLRNITLTAPYMHDGRFNTLKEVLDFYSENVKLSPTIDSKMEYAHLGGVQLSENEKWSIIAFLKTLTDSTFITNPEFSNPHITK